MKKIFKPRARMLIQLGDQLIKSENIAVVELVKNAYDAGANNCEVVLKNIDSKKISEIIIKDDGIGMTKKVIEEVWLEPGADFKELIINQQLDLFEYSYTTERTPIGEKGIGRFGVHKLGDYIEMITKSANSKKEIVVTLDWQKFKSNKYLENAQFDVIERTPELFIDGGTGTYISIKKIRTDWTIFKFRDLYRTINSLNSPFKEKGLKNEFSVNLKLKLKEKEKQSKWEEKKLSIQEIKNLALWRLKCTISGNKIAKFKYEFLPYSQMDKLEKYSLTETSKKIKELTILSAEADLSSHKIGDVELELNVFYLGSKILRLGNIDNSEINKFLKQNGGVRVYRDDMRIYSYGEIEDDWLNLDQQRVSNVGGKIGNKLILGAVSLDRKVSTALREKTNREGFVENEAYSSFKASILQVIGLFNNLRNLDKLKIKEFYEGVVKSEPVLYNVDELKQLAEEKINDLSEGLSKEKQKYAIEIRDNIIVNLDIIKKQYIETHDILIKSAGAGLNLSVVIHEIEKRIRELEKVIESLGADTKELEENPLEKTKKIVEDISQLVGNYADLVSNKQKKSIPLKKVVNDALFNTEFRFCAHKTVIIKAFENAKDQKIVCASNVIVGALLNIFDNSLYWLNTYAIEEKKLYINFRDYRDEIGLLIVDNGKGFTINSEDAIRPFISMKNGGTGLGLHIVDEMMKVHNGRLIIRNSNEVDIPKEFERGAIIELIFKKEK